MMNNTDININTMQSADSKYFIVLFRLIIVIMKKV